MTDATVISTVPESEIVSSTVVANSIDSVSAVPSVQKTVPSSITVPGVPVTVTCPEALLACFRVTFADTPCRSSHSPQAHIGNININVRVRLYCISLEISIAVGMVKSCGKSAGISEISTGRLFIILDWMVSGSLLSINSGVTNSPAKFSSPFQCYF